MFSHLRKWWRRQRWLSRAALPSPRPDLHFLLYTRKQCHLCTDAWKLLSSHQKKRGFLLEVLDVDTSADLVVRFGNCVPVVMVNGEVRFRGRINEVLLQRILDGHP